MPWYKRLWNAIPRKLKYCILTIAVTSVKARWPDAPLPDVDTIAVLGGVGLVGGHVATDIAYGVFGNKR